MNTSYAATLSKPNTPLFPAELIRELQALPFHYVQDKNRYPEANPELGPILREKIVFDSMPAKTLQTLARIMDRTYGQTVRDGRSMLDMGAPIDPQNVEIVGRIPLDQLQSCGLQIEGRNTEKAHGR